MSQSIALPGVTFTHYSPSMETTVLTPRGETPLAKLARQMVPNLMGTSWIVPVVKRENLMAAWEDIRTWYELLPSASQRRVEVKLDGDDLQIRLTPKTPALYAQVKEIVGAVSTKFDRELHQKLPASVMATIVTPEQIFARMEIAAIKRA